jgi:cardiolipin synthase
MGKAIDYCYFTSPYFLPPEQLIKSMIETKRRGVDVRILCAGLSDVPLMRYAGRHVYKRLLEHNVRIYEMQKPMLHRKTITIDGLYCCIGSFNLDLWSAHRNLEVNVIMLDNNFAEQLKNIFIADISVAEEINNKTFAARSIFKHFFCWCCYQLMRI